MKRSIIILIIIAAPVLLGGNLPADKARGIFAAFGVGPRVPVSEFSRSARVGYGFDVELAYTDNSYLPIFLFAKIGFEQYPGSNELYESTQYSNLSTTSVPINIGGRYYFAPMLENVVLFIPYLEISAGFNYYSKLHQFKIGSGLSNYTENISKIGGSAGIGISMFLMEILASYNYFQNNQFISMDIKVRLPLYISY